MRSGPLARGSAGGHLAGLAAEDLALVDAFRALLAELPDVSEKVNASEVRWLRQRTFAVTFVRSDRLEIAVDLLREVDHPLLRARFATSKRVVTHRICVERVDQLDDVVAALLAEAHGTVGPGFR